MPDSGFGPLPRLAARAGAGDFDMLLDKKNYRRLLPLAAGARCSPNCTEPRTPDPQFPPEGPCFRPTT
ncbi:hypothetical protein GCM10017771_42020 [Streptomyces capitiformicae]|uniref:Uncharacterized protein n=1 Tax=Streptomyces capitiformicae TaxID=2014920 RepID=A0A918YZ74_9ACTN|nr:hypothetical protein GCM10017771_42020 [Streptomyces capitiformicae]